MAWSLRSLRDRFYAWVVVKGITYAFERLAAAQLGLKLGQALDDRFGKDRTDVVQKELAAWLERVARELRA